MKKAKKNGSKLQAKRLLKNPKKVKALKKKHVKFATKSMKVKDSRKGKKFNRRKRV